MQARINAYGPRYTGFYKQLRINPFDYAVHFYCTSLLIFDHLWAYLLVSLWLIRSFKDWQIQSLLIYYQFGYQSNLIVIEYSF